VALLAVYPLKNAVANTDASLARPATPALNAPGSIASQLPSARLAGEGLLRWFGFRIYQARLFVGEAYDHARPMLGPIALELTYKRDFDGQSIAQRSADEIESLNFGTQTQRATWASQMAAIFPDVAEGDRLTGILTASGQTLFLHNDKLLGQINDPAFGPAFFGIWLDERTSAPSLRAALIGKIEPPEPVYESAQ